LGRLAIEPESSKINAAKPASRPRGRNAPEFIVAAKAAHVNALTPSKESLALPYRALA
jgi:hypothetical protein